MLTRRSWGELKRSEERIVSLDEGGFELATSPPLGGGARGRAQMIPPPGRNGAGWGELGRAGRAVCVEEVKRPPLDQVRRRTCSTCMSVATGICSRAATGTSLE